MSPALYADERKYVVRVVGGGYAMFLLGVAVSYFLIFPLTFRFLGTYQVSGEVENMISLQSYISTLMTMSLAMGLVFEIPILSWLFAKLGFLSAGFMRRYRNMPLWSFSSWRPSSRRRRTSSRCRSSPCRCGCCTR